MSCAIAVTESVARTTHVMIVVLNISISLSSGLSLWSNHFSSRYELFLTLVIIHDSNCRTSFAGVGCYKLPQVGLDSVFCRTTLSSGVHKCEDYRHWRRIGEGSWIFVNQRAEKLSFHVLTSCPFRTRYWTRNFRKSNSVVLKRIFRNFGLVTAVVITTHLSHDEPG